MESNLRPLSLGEILDRTAQLYRSNFVLFAGIAAVYAGMLLILSLLQIGVAEAMREMHLARQMQWVSAGIALLVLPLVFIFAGAAMAANNRAVAWVNLGQPATIRGAYASILPRLGRYLWLMTIAAFIAYLPIAILYAAYLAFIVLYLRPNGGFAAMSVGNPDPQTSVVIVVVTVVLVLLSIPALVYAVWMALRYSLAIPASVVEDLKARPALRRSVALTQGSRGRIFVLGLLIAVIQIGLVLVAQIFFVVMAFKQRGVLPAWAQALQQIIAFFTNSFIGPMYATGLTLFYYDQRVRKEGFDIEWMMQAAGMTAVAPQPTVEAYDQARSVDPSPHPEPSKPASEPEHLAAELNEGSPEGGASFNPRKESTESPRASAPDDRSPENPAPPETPAGNEGPGAAHE
jgi:uncharacterized membrane protein